MALLCFVVVMIVLTLSLHGQATAAAAAQLQQHAQQQPAAARGSSTGTAGTAEPRQQRTFGIEEDAFMRDGAPVPLISGSVHYTRVHPAYWKDRLMRLRAMGLNTVCTYVPWMLHQRAADAEPAFDGPLDLAAFVREAQAQGLMVLLRLGPFIDAEYDFGGLPAWLLNLSAPALGAIRTNDTAYTSAVSRWFEALLPRVRPLLYENGGPIVMVQIENEYGAFAGSGLAPPTAAQTAYKSLLLGLARRMLGPHATVYTTDGDRLAEMERGSFNDSRVFSAPDFGPGDPGFRGAAEMASAAAALRAMNPKGLAPLLCSEFYSGWATHWGQPVATTSSSAFLVGNLSNWLRHGGGSDGGSSSGIQRAAGAEQQLAASVNLYMAHGGSTPGWWGGGDADAQPNGTCIENYTAYTASYDFNAPISESGGHGIGSDGGDKYAALRALLAPITRAPPEPPQLPRVSFGSVEMKAVGESLLAPATLRSLVPPSSPSGGSGAIISAAPQKMEAFGANYGFSLYEADLPTSTSSAVDGGGGRNLTLVGGVRDRVIAALDGQVVGTVWRGDIKGCNDRDVTLVLPPPSSAHHVAPSELGETTAKSVRASAGVGVERLQLLVEITGRLAYGKQMQIDALRGKGLVGGSGSVLLDGVAVEGPWMQWRLPLDHEQLQRWPRRRPQQLLRPELVQAGNDAGPDSARPEPESAWVAGGVTSHPVDAVPHLFEGRFDVNATNTRGDCWVHLDGWHKGYVYINGFNLGRFWTDKGPRTAMFLAAPLLKEGSNLLQVLELHAEADVVARGARLELRDTP